MKVVFWSSVEYQSFMPAIIDSLKRMDVEARQEFLVSYKSYRSASGAFKKLALRAKTYLIYPVYLFARALFSRSEIWIVCSNTFYAPYIATISKYYGNIKVINLQYDLYPEALEVAGVIKRDGFVSQLCRSIVGASLKLSDSNVILSSRLSCYIEKQYPKSGPMEVIPVGTADATFCKRRILEEELKGPLRILYCGNFGRMHDYETLVRLFQEGEWKDLEWNFFSSGFGVEKLKDALAKDASSTVRFGTSLSDGEWKGQMESADVGLVTMQPGAELVLFPSKTYSAMAAGQAILAICPRESDLADLVSDNAIGWVVECGDSEGLATTLTYMQSNRQAVTERGIRAQELCKGLFSAQPVAKQWKRFLAEVATRNDSISL